eukprot:TRINITY_DN202_c0_g2_i1.p1 TRINITY_DN202_c0_g2~~TRINITY_DN202_c0_g2_i1.p1  ORF type:complete len:765 (+),score=89.40 TRINITY_DN202_c0_g2_i1:485-2779(+)
MCSLCWLFIALFCLSFGEDTLTTRIVKVASVVPMTPNSFGTLDPISPDTQKGIACSHQMWADIWNSKDFTKANTLFKIQLDHIPVGVDNATLVANEVISMDYDYIIVETNVISLDPDVWGQSGKIIITNSPFLVCPKKATRCVPKGPLYPRIFSSSFLRNHDWWHSALSLTMSVGAKDLFFVVSDILSDVYDDFHEHASQLTILNNAGSVTLEDEMTQKDVTQLMKSARDANPDHLVILVSSKACPLVYVALEELNWTPPSIWTLLCMMSEAYLDEVMKPSLTKNAWYYSMHRLTDMHYFSDTRLSTLTEPFLQQYGEDYYFHVPDSINQTSFEVFLEQYEEKCQLEYEQNIPTMFLAGELIGDSIMRSMSLEPADIELALRQADFNSFMLTFKMYKDNTRQLDSSVSVTTVQQTPDGPRMLSPTEWSTSNLIFPMPTFEERLPVSTDLSISEIVIYALTAITITFCTVTFCAVMIFHDSPVIRASSPIFLAFICLGLGMGSASNFFWRYTYTTTPDCHLHVWMLNCGFSIAFGSLFVRTLKIDRLWNARTLAGRPLSDLQLGSVFGGIVGLQIILLVIWSAVTQPHAYQYVKESIRPIRDQYICKTGEANDVLIGLMVGFSGVLLVVGAVLAYRVRQVPMKVVNESRMIAISIYNLLVFSVVIVILEISEIDRELNYIIRSILILISALLTLILLFGTKTRAQVILSDDVNSSAGTVVSGRSPGSRSESMVSKAVEDQKDIEIKKLKEELARCKKPVGERIRA